MRKVADVAGSDLTRVQQSVGKQAYEFRAGTEVVATLVWPRGSMADAEADGRHWRFLRGGFWQPRVTARMRGPIDSNVAVLCPAWMGGGTLELAAGTVVASGVS